MSLSLLSLFSIKKPSSFVPLNFINDTIIRGTASEVSPAIATCAGPARSAPPLACAKLINPWSPALHELHCFLTIIPLRPLNFIRPEPPRFIYDTQPDGFGDNFETFTTTAR
ncbi:unnamed protein product, partial [Iphiclides podalirius]